MSEFNGSLFKVTMTEYDRGVQRPMGTKLFTTEGEAKRFCAEWSDFSSPDCYFRADYTRIQ